MQIPDPTQFEVSTKLPIFGYQLSPLAPELVQAREAVHELQLSHPEPLQSNVKGGRATYLMQNFSRFVSLSLALPNMQQSTTGIQIFVS